MKNKTKVNILVSMTLLTFLLFHANSAKGQVQVILRQPPPNQLHIEDLWKLTLINNSQNQLSIYITATVTEAGRGSIISAVSKSFILSPGIKNISIKELGEVSVDYQSPGIEDLIKKTGSVPSGDYDLCIKVFSVPDNSEIGSMCIEHDVNNFSNLILLTPADGEKISETLPVFNWMPLTPVKAGENVTYSLRLVEILPRQTPVDAMLSNPAFFEQKNLMSPVIRYPLASRGFEKNKKYAWKIEASVNGIPVSESEVREFKYEPVEDEALKYPKKSRVTGRSSLFMNDMEHDYTSYDTSDPDFTSLHFSISRRKGSLAGFSSFQKDLKRKTEKFIISGSSRIYTQKSNRSGTNQNLPSNIARWEFNPMLSYYNIPLSLSLLLTTEQRSFRQNINNFSIGFDYEALLERIKNTAVDGTLSESVSKKLEELSAQLSKGNLSRGDSLKLLSQLKDVEKMQSDIENIKSLKDPGEVIDKIEKYGGKVPGLSKFFLAFRKVGIGTNYPDYSRFTLNAVPVTGLDFEINPGLFYLAVTGIKNQKAIQKTENDQPVYERKILAGKIGIGKNDYSHFYVTYMYAWDKEESIIRDSSAFVNPMKNHVLGLEGKLSLFENKLVINGQIAGSLLTRDVTAPDIQNSAIPSFIQRMFDIKMSSSVDYSYSVNAAFALDKTNTKISAAVSQVGPGYVSLGSPNLRNDNFTYEIRLSQGFVDNKISVTSFYRGVSDNLIEWKKTTSKNTSYGVSLSLQSTGLPYLRLSFSPNYQSSNGGNDSFDVNNKISMFNISTGYSYYISNISNYTAVTFSLLDSKSRTELNNYSNKNFMLNHSLSFSFPLTLGASYGLTQSKLFQDYSKITFFDFNASYVLFNIWQNTLGFSKASEFNSNNKFGLYLNSVFTLPVIGTLNLRIERNLYKDKKQGNNNYDEFVLKATVTSSW